MLRFFKRILPPRWYEIVDRLLWGRLTWRRAGMITRSAVAALLGRPVICHRCGKRIVKVFAFVSGGKVSVWGLHATGVRVEFHDRLTLRFSHAYAPDCVRSDR